MSIVTSNRKLKTILADAVGLLNTPVPGWVELLEEDLFEDEDFRGFPYDDLDGAPVKAKGKVTIAIGLNLNANPLSLLEGAVLLRLKTHKVLSECENNLEPYGWRTWSDGQKRAVANMAYQLGIRGVLGFRKFLAHAKFKQWGAAAAELVDSEWYKLDTPARAKRVVTRWCRGSGLLA